MAKLYVVAGVDTSDSGPAIQTSPDASTWTDQTVPGSLSVNSVTAGGPLFIAQLSTSSSTNNYLRSPDAITWTVDSTGTTNSIAQAIYGGGTYVAVRAGNSITSTDGLSWTVNSSVLPSGTTWNDITYGGGVFVAVGQTSGSSDTIAYSSDGATWSTVTTTGLWRTVTYGAGMFVVHRGGATGQEGDAKTDHTMTSPDGASWTTRSSYGGSWSQSAYQGGVFLAIGDGFNSGTTPNNFAIRMTSTDGTTWSYSRELALPRPIAGEHQLVGGGGQFVYATRDGAISTSTSGTSWSTTTFTDRSWRGIAYYEQRGGGIYRDGAIHRS
jgi:hypothetical protein